MKKPYPFRAAFVNLEEATEYLISLSKVAAHGILPDRKASILNRFQSLREQSNGEYHLIIALIKKFDCRCKEEHMEDLQIQRYFRHMSAIFKKSFKDPIQGFNTLSLTEPRNDMNDSEEDKIDEFYQLVLKGYTPFTYMSAHLLDISFAAHKSLYQVVLDRLLEKDLIFDAAELIREYGFIGKYSIDDIIEIPLRKKTIEILRLFRKHDTVSTADMLNCIEKKCSEWIENTMESKEHILAIKDISLFASELIYREELHIKNVYPGIYTGYLSKPLVFCLEEISNIVNLNLYSNLKILEVILNEKLHLLRRVLASVRKHDSGGYKVLLKFTLNFLQQFPAARQLRQNLQIGLQLTSDLFQWNPNAPVSIGTLSESPTIYKSNCFIVTVDSDMCAEALLTSLEYSNSVLQQFNYMKKTIISVDTEWLPDMFVLKWEKQKGVDVIQLGIRNLHYESWPMEFGLTEDASRLCFILCVDSIERNLLSQIMNLIFQSESMTKLGFSFVNDKLLLKRTVALSNDSFVMKDLSLDFYVDGLMPSLSETVEQVLGLSMILIKKTGLKDWCHRPLSYLLMEYAGIRFLLLTKMTLLIYTSLRCHVFDRYLYKTI